MSDFNRHGTDLSQTRNREYHTHMWRLRTTKAGMFMNDGGLDAYINECAGKGFVLDSVTLIGAPGMNVLLIFVRN